jgi:hypothetical protein
MYIFQYRPIFVALYEVMTRGPGTLYNQNHEGLTFNIRFNRENLPPNFILGPCLF